MNYFPCNNIGISVDGEPHQGVLKLRNEYVPIVNAYRFSDPYNYDSSIAYDEFYGCGCAGENIIVGLGSCPMFSPKGEIYNTNINKQAFFNRIVESTQAGTTQYKSLAFIDGELYGVYYATIFKFNEDGSKTNVFDLPTTSASSTQYFYVGGFKTENGERCLYIRGQGSNHGAYIYNLDTRVITDVKTSNIEKTLGSYLIFESNEPNVVYMWQKSTDTLNSYNLYKCNVKTDTMTAISAPNARYNSAPGYQYPKAFMSIVVDEKVFFVYVYAVKAEYGYDHYRYIDHLIIFDEETHLLHYEKLDNIKKIHSVFPYGDSIGLLESYYSECKVSSSSAGRAKNIYRVFKFDPKTHIMYDMSIPHLVIDE